LSALQKGNAMELTREFFDTLIIVVIVIGLALASVRLYRDFTRPLPTPNTPQKPPRQEKK
jgi:cytochrome c oxidase assembly protein Cox11